MWTFVPESALTPSPPDDARYKVATELVETEEAYGESISLLADTLIAPLKQPGVSILPAPAIARIFSSTERIAAVSKELSSALRAPLKAGSYDAARAPLGAVILHTLRSQDGLLGGSRFADAHVQYVNNFEQSQRALDSADKTNPEWRQFLKAWHLLMPAVGKGDVQLHDLLIRPVQRVPRLKLLLEQLLRETPPKHPDRAATEGALEEVTKIAIAVNEAIRRREALEAVYAMQRSEFTVGTELVKPGRHLVRRLDDAYVGWPPISAVGTSRQSTAESKLKQLTLILFNDALLLSERNALGGKLSVFHWWLPTGVDGTRPGEATGTLHATRAGNETLTFVAPAAEHQAWLASLQKVSASLSVGLERTQTLTTATGQSFTHGGPGAGVLTTRAAAKAEHEAVAAAGAGKGTGVLAGWLRKKGGSGSDGGARNWAKGGRRNWKWRWVVVTNTQFISWFENDKCKELKGSLALMGAQVSSSEKHKNGFWILTNSRSLELMAESPETAARWISVVQATANKVQLSTKLPRVSESPQHAPPAAPPPRPPTREAIAHGPRRVRALFDYAASREDELSIRVGDVIELVSSEGDWWIGFIGDAKGAFPSNYVEALPGGLGRQMSDVL